MQPKPTPDNLRWPYTAGFLATPAAWDYYQSDLSDDIIASRISQGPRHYLWIPGLFNAKYFGRTLAEVSYPSAKVHVHDTHQRHFGPREHYFAAFAADGKTGLARTPATTFDGSAGVRASADSNPGWHPKIPTNPCDFFFCAPRSWEPATTNGEPNQLCAGVYRWTRGGLKGIDFDALPIDTGQKSPGECQF